MNLVSKKIKCVTCFDLYFYTFILFCLIASPLPPFKSYTSEYFNASLFNWNSTGYFTFHLLFLSLHCNICAARETNPFFPSLVTRSRKHKISRPGEKGIISFYVLGGSLLSQVPELKFLFSTSLDKQVQKKSRR